LRSMNACPTAGLPVICILRNTCLVCESMYISMCVCLCVCIHTQTYVYICTHINIYTYIHTKNIS
jgi:hypothetical protein